MTPPIAFRRYSPNLGYASHDAMFDAAAEDWTLREHGVIEDDQPTDYSHRVWMAQWETQMYGAFTPEERGEIRAALGLGPFKEMQP
jgi:hypothetical protein